MKRVAAAAVICILLLTGCGGNGDRESVRKGIFYEAAGIRPDAVLVRVNGRPVSAGQYLYWLSCNCSWLEEQLGEDLDWDESRGEVRLAEYVKEMTLENVALGAVLQAQAEREGVTLSEADLAEVEQELRRQEAEDGETGCGNSLLASEEDRPFVLECAAEARLYGMLKERFQPDATALKIWTDAVGMLTVDCIQLKEQEQIQQVGEAALQRLESAEDPGAEWAALEAELGQSETLTFRAGESGWSSGFETAAAGLGENEGCLATDPERGVALLLRRPVDSAAAAGAYFDASLREAVAQAEIVCEKNYRSVDVEDFCRKLEKIAAEQGT